MLSIHEVQPMKMCIYINHKLRQRIDEACKYEYRKLSQFISYCVMQYLDRQQANSSQDDWDNVSKAA
jgi:hypothetical protein